MNQNLAMPRALVHTAFGGRKKFSLIQQFFFRKKKLYAVFSLINCAEKKQGRGVFFIPFAWGGRQIRDSQLDACSNPNPNANVTFRNSEYIWPVDGAAQREIFSFEGPLFSLEYTYTYISESFPLTFLFTTPKMLRWLCRKSAKQWLLFYKGKARLLINDDLGVVYCGRILVQL